MMLHYSCDSKSWRGVGLSRVQAVGDLILGLKGMKKNNCTIRWRHHYVIIMSHDNLMTSSCELELIWRQRLLNDFVRQGGMRAWGYYCVGGIFIQSEWENDIQLGFGISRFSTFVFLWFIMKIMSSFSSLCFSKNNVSFITSGARERARTKRSVDKFVSYARTGIIKLNWNKLSKWSNFDKSMVREAYYLYFEPMFDTSGLVDQQSMVSVIPF